MSKKKVLVICPHPRDVAPGQRLKYEQYFSSFEQNGYEIEISPFMSINFWNIVYKKGYFFHKVYYTILGYFRRILDIFRIRKYDAIYVFLWVTPFGTSLFEIIFRKLSSILIYDIDDMVFLGHSSHANRKLQFLKGKSKMIYLMKNADHVITCTPKLDEFVRRFNMNTTDISSTINTDIYQPDYSLDESKKIVLGWSGSHSTSRYLRLLEPVFEQLLKQDVDFTVLVIGDANFKFDNEAIDVAAIPWKRETEVSDLTKIDIGLYPLPDAPWVYGKSGLKALQYMALEIPTIATAIGANFRVIEHNKSGYLVNDNEEWLKTILILIQNLELRKSIGFEARKRVIEYYSIKANEAKYLSVLNKLTGKQ